MGQKLEDIKPRRVSLVKRGANRRRILLHKSDDGAHISDNLAAVLATIAPNEAGLLDAVEKNGGDESVAEAAAAFARAGAALTDAYDGNIPEAVAKAMGAVGSLNDDDEDDPNNGDKDLDDNADDIDKAYVEIRKRAFTADERKAAAKKGTALPNGSYPIENEEDLHNAIHAIGRGKEPHTEIKAHIVTRAKALGATSQLPDEWKVNKEDGMTETAQAVPVKKEDGTWDLTAVPEDSRAAFETVIKALDDEKAEAVKKAEVEASRAENAEKIAKAVQEKIEKAEHVAKAEGYANLAKDDSEFGELLYSIRKAEDDGHLPTGSYDKLNTVLAAANEAAADVYKQAGRNGHSTGGTDAMAKIEKVAEELRAADRNLTKPQAIAKALKADPDLYAEYEKERA